MAEVLHFDVFDQFYVIDHQHWLSKHEEAEELFILELVAHIKLVEGAVLLHFQKVNRAPRELSRLERNAQLVSVVKVRCDQPVEKEEEEKESGKELPAEVDGAEENEEGNELQQHS